MANNHSILINPFDRLSDRKMIFIGLVAYFIASIQAYLFSYAVEGLLHLRPVEGLPWYTGFISHALNILVLASFLWLCSKIFYRRIRWQDVAIVVMIAQVVNYVVALLMMNPFVRIPFDQIHQAVLAGDMTLTSVSPLDLTIVVAIAMISLALLVYFFYLLVVGMKIAINAKRKVDAVWIVLVTLIVDVLLNISVKTIF